MSVVPPESLVLRPATDPTAIYRYRDGLYAADLLTAGIVHLDLFTRLHEQPVDRDGLCAMLELKPRPADVMITLFVAMGFLEEKNGTLSLTPVAREHLVSSSLWFIGPYYASLKDRPVCLDFLDVLRSGVPARWGGYRAGEEWARAMEDPGFARQFTAAMDCRGVFLGQALARTVNPAGRHALLDVAGGSGIYACALVAAHPHLKARVFEKPPVDAVARTAIEERGFSAAVSVQAGDMFAGAWPAGFDLHLISNVLHDWDFPRVRQLLQHSFDALLKGGQLIVHDAHINRDKSGPLEVAAYSAMLMHSTEGKCYSVLEMEELLGGMGFSDIRHAPTAADRSIITAVKA